MSEEVLKLQIKHEVIISKNKILGIIWIYEYFQKQANNCTYQKVISIVNIIFLFLGFAKFIFNQACNSQY